MSNDKRTPGPWLRDRSSGVRCDVRASNGRKVALCWGLSTSAAARNNTPAYRDECDANANLIAAAPELLDALQRLLEQARQYGHTPEIEDAERAIAKATGAKP